jgi:hypothetical protein
MPFVHYTSGPTYVAFDNLALGFCEDRVQITIQPFYDDIHADSWGGLAGSFADRQLLGAVAQINCLFTKYNKEYLDELTSFTSGGTAGTIGAGGVLGEFVYQDKLYSNLDLKGTNETIHFTHAHIAMGIEFNSSMRHRRYQAGFMARMDDACTGILFSLLTGISCVDDYS